MTAFFAAAPAAKAAEQESDGASFVSILWRGAEWPGKIILLMSVASVTIIIQHFLTIRRGSMAPDDEIETARKMIENRQFREVIEFVRGRPSMFADVLTASLRHGRHGFDAMRVAAEERSAAWNTRLFRRVENLHIIGNLGPLMGLLGTVLGMIRAFSAMQAAHGAYKPEDLAGGIGLALVNTFLGLTVAILSLGFFGFCRNRVDTYTVAAHAAVLDVIEFFRPAPAMPPAPINTARPSPGPMSGPLQTMPFGTGSSPAAMRPPAPTTPGSSVQSDSPVVESRPSAAAPGPFLHPGGTGPVTASHSTNIGGSASTSTTPWRSSRDADSDGESSGLHP